MLTKLNNRHARENGFTLIELLVVVIVIGLLAAIALPVFLNQQRAAVDASVKSDVHNTVTNITGAQAQKLGVAKAAVSNATTNIALILTSDSSYVVATKAAPDLTNVPALGVAYSIQGWNPNGNQYKGVAAAPSFAFDSATGKFTQAIGDAPDPDGGAAADPGTGSGSTGGSAQSAPTWTTGQALPSGTQGTAYTATLAASGNPAVTYALASGSTLPTGLTLTSAGVLSGTPSVTGSSSSFTINAVNTTGSTINTVPRTFSLALAAATPNAAFTFTNSGLVATFNPGSSSYASGTDPYLWSWGDGSADQRQSGTSTITHTYAAAGTYTVKLTARNGVSGPTGSASQSVTVAVPPLYDWNFENTAEGFTGSAGVPSTVYAQKGSYSFKVQSGEVRHALALTAGKSYTITGYGLAQTSGSYYSFGIVNNSTGNYSVILNPVQSGTWSRFSVTFTAVSSQYFQVYEGQPFYLDNVTITAN